LLPFGSRGTRDVEVMVTRNLKAGRSKDRARARWICVLSGQSLSNREDDRPSVLDRHVVPYPPLAVTMSMVVELHWGTNPDKHWVACCARWLEP
jgi:hypothetical protein